ncbi:TIR domain-containing protein [Streptomyces sp. NPDC032472]|uniref:TIR domain-containing protein n=1 Tax=Streptomyces sp. NPDC032472 TaxID=3155018 RepID=UPI0033C2CF9D
MARRWRLRAELGYGAFLSYSGERDRGWLPHLRRAIEKQSRPWYKPPRIRVFLDDSSISIGPQLWGKIEAGLARSDWLVVMASPESKASVWVDREIEWWLRHKSVDTILLLVTAGLLVWDEQRGDWDPELSTALPARLLGRFTQQPVWKSLALRQPENGTGPVPDVDDVALGIASVVRGLAEEDLRSEGIRDTRRNLRTARITAAVLGLLLLVASTVSVIALIARAEAARQRDHAVAQQLIGQSSFLAIRDPFGARLKALAAWRIDPTPESRLAVLNAAANPASGLLAHSWPVKSVAFSPDAKTIATGSDDGVVRLWDAATQRKIGEYIGHHQAVTSVAFGPSGETLISSGFDGTVRLWSIADHKQIGDAFDARAGMISSAALSPDGRTLILVGDGSSGAVQVWDVATHRRIGDPLGGRAYGSGTVAFSPDGRTFATGARNEVQLWDAGSHAPLGTALTISDHQVSSVSFSGDGRTIAASDTDGSVQLWDPATRAPIGKPFAADAGWVGSVAFSPDGAVFAASYADGSVRLWDIVGHTQVGAPLTGHISNARAVAFSPDGSTLASASDDTTVRLWDVRAQRQIGTPVGTGGHGAAAFSPRGHLLAMGGSSYTVRFWDIASRRQIGDPLVSRDVDAGSPFSLNPDGTVLATTSFASDYAVTLWDTTTHRRIGEPLPTGDGYIRAMAFSPDGKSFATSGRDSVRLWDLATHGQIGKELAVSSWRLDFSPDGRTLATNTADDTVALWDVATQRRIGETPPSHTAQINEVTFSPDGTMLATASRDSTVRLWNVATREQIGEPLTGHRGGVTSVAFSPNGRTLVTGSMDHTVRLWDVTTRQQIGAPLEGHSADVTGVGFGPAGKTIAAWGKEDTLRLWDAEPTVDPVDSLCRWARGAFDAGRWREYVPAGPAFQPLCPR